MLERYNDIDEVFIQSTYWNRFLMACSRNQDVGDGIKADSFIDDPTRKDTLIPGIVIHRITDDYVELTEKSQIQQCMKNLKDSNFMTAKTITTLVQTKSIPFPNYGTN